MPLENLWGVSRVPAASRPRCTVSQSASQRITLGVFSNWTNSHRKTCHAFCLRAWSAA